MSELCVCGHHCSSHTDSGCIVADCFCEYLLPDDYDMGSEWHGIPIDPELYDEEDWRLGPDDAEPDADDSADYEGRP